MRSFCRSETDHISKKHLAGKFTYTEGIGFAESKKHRSERRFLFT